MNIFHVGGFALSVENKHLMMAGILKHAKEWPRMFEELSSLQRKEPTTEQPDAGGFTTVARTSPCHHAVMSDPAMDALDLLTLVAD